MASCIGLKMLDVESLVSQSLAMLSFPLLTVYLSHGDSTWGGCEYHCRHRRRDDPLLHHHGWSQTREATRYHRVSGGRWSMPGLWLTTAPCHVLAAQHPTWFPLVLLRKRIKKVSSEFHWEVSASNASLLAMCDNMQQILVGWSWMILW